MLDAASVTIKLQRHACSVITHDMDPRQGMHAARELHGAGYWGYGGGLAPGPEKNVGVADVFAGSKSVLASTVSCNSRTKDRVGSAIVDDTLSSRCCAVLRLVFA